MPLIVLMSSSGQSRDVLDAIVAAGNPVAGLLWDEAPGSAFWGIPVLGSRDGWREHARDSVEFVVALGGGKQREEYGEAIVGAGARLVPAIHPTAWVSPRATLGRGVAILAGVNVSPDASIGDYVVLNANCSVDHDCVLERGVQFGPGVMLAGNVTVEAGAFVGVGASVMPGVHIGAGALVGAGAVVIRDVPPGAKVAGNPARTLGQAL